MENNSISKKVKPMIEKWKKDYTFKTIASSIISFGVSILFALYNGFLGIHLLSVWHGSICVFYLLLIAIRGMILLTEKKNIAGAEQEREHCRCRTFVISSVMLLLLNLALILPISLMVILEKPVNMGVIPAITMAAYTTYKLTMASVHIQKQRHSRHGNILIGQLRTINFIDALVSILTLQNTLIMVEQTESSVDDMFILSAVSSAAIYIVILFITIRLLMIGLKRYKK
ncbi:hypothetical protein LQE92_02675 [Lacrimispora sp. NSJ-141]|uniref:Uncharacterized protein n=1 Tax=Lientehia hominis TaxID=2897778 RepID=A0AAP2W6Q7_9FIRM|nr:hypothetical protein [Lientehia hominis]MCD2491533.1 hypothetical protein [Lientehia hominis]